MADTSLALTPKHVGCLPWMRGTAAACAGCWRARQSGARAATAGPMPRERRIPRPGYGRARRGAVCARDGHGRRRWHRIAGVTLARGVRGHRFRTAACRLQEAGPDNSDWGPLNGSPVPGETTAGALWSPTVSDRSLCS